MLGEYGPILKTLKKIADPLGLGPVIDSLEGEIEKAVEPLLEGGATVPGLYIVSKSVIVSVTYSGIRLHPLHALYTILGAWYLL